MEAKRQRREVNRPRPSSAVNEWSYTTAVPIRLHDVDTACACTLVVKVKQSLLECEAADVQWTLAIPITRLASVQSIVYHTVTAART
jgi:hypothetical protein